SFSVHGGRVFVGAPEEGIEPVSIRSVGKFSGQSKDTLGVPVPNDVVTADDSIIQGSQCVGLDCVNNESFGFDTVRLKENNTRLKFDETWTTAGCSNKDWQLTGTGGCRGAYKFPIEDSPGSKVACTRTVRARANSAAVAGTG